MKKINKILIATSIFMFVAVLVLYFFNRRQGMIQPQPAQLQANTPATSLPSTQNGAAPSPGEEPAISGGSTITLEDKLKDTPLPGKQTNDPLILEKYGKYAFETLSRNPEIVGLTKNLDKNFDPASMEISSLSRTFELKNGKKYLAMAGCATGNCGGTEKIIIYDEVDKKAFMAEENSDQTQLLLLGNPGEQEKYLLIYIYFHR